VRILTVTNLYPSAARPVHGVFVEERMTRYAARQGAELRVVAPVPWFPFTSGFGEYSRIARTPRRETRKGIDVLHPRVPIVPKVGMGLAPFWWRQVLTPLLRRIRTEWPFDLLDAHYIFPDCVALVEIARRLGVPIVVSARGTDVHLIGDLPGPRERIRDACAAASGVVAVSKALAAHLTRLGVPEGKITVVPNGADVDSFAPPPSAPLTRRFPGRVLLGIGRLVPQKGFHLAVEAVATLAPKYPDLTLVFAGSGGERENLTELAERKGIGTRVHFLGEVEHDRIPELLWSADRLILPSFREGYPNVVVEAIAAGTPVVATAIGGIPEIVDDSVGDLAEQPGAAAFTQALDRSLGRAFDRSAFAARREGLRWERSLDLLRQVFERAIEAGPPR
jgi:glycosyltransferase involved in cell wall biosynthesis